MNTNANRTTLSALIAAGALATIAAPAAHAQQDPMVSDRAATTAVNRGYVRPNRKRIAQPTPVHPKLVSYERSLNSLGFTLSRSADVWTAAPKVTAAVLNAQIADNQLAGIADLQFIDLTVHDTFVKSFEAGDVGSLWAGATFRIDHSATRSMARLQGEGRIEGALFGNTRTLGLATADLFAPSTGKSRATFGLSVMGQSIWSKNVTGNTVNLTDGKDWTARLWQMGFDISIAGYGVGAEVWLEGTIGAHYTAQCSPLRASMGADASAAIAVGGRAYADLGIVYADLEAHLDLVKLAVGTGASTNVSFGKDRTLPPRMHANRRTTVDLNFLSGYAKLKVKEPFFDSTLGSWTLWNNPNGLFHLTGVLDQYSQSTVLP